MAGYLGVPRERIDVVHPGRNQVPIQRPPPRPKPVLRTVSFRSAISARICPEKGLHHLIAAFRLLKQMPDSPPCRLRVRAGWAKTTCPFSRSKTGTGRRGTT